MKGAWPCRRAPSWIAIPSYNTSAVRAFRGFGIDPTAALVLRDTRTAVFAVYAKDAAQWPELGR